MSKQGNGFSAKRFLRDTLSLNLEARGLAITLLCLRLQRGDLPRDTESLARLSGAFPEEIRRHWPSIKALVLPSETESLLPKVLDPEEVETLDMDQVAKKCGADLSAAEIHAVVQEVFCAYVDHHPRAKPGPEDEARIRKRLKEGFSMDDLMLAIEGCHKSPYHSGDNDRQRKYQSMELIFRNGDKVNSFMELAAGGTNAISNRERQTATASQSLLDMEFGNDAR